jgi:hypothetical protein
MHAAGDGFDGAVLLNAGCGSAAKVFEGHESFTFQDATCGCSCGPAAALCTLPAQASSFPNTECSADKLTGIFTPSEICVGVPGGQMTHSVQLDGAPGPPSCVSDMGPADIPDIVFSSPLEGCSFESIGCGADLCVPTGERYCLYRVSSGPAVECPAGLSDTPLIQAADIDDSRDCNCPCGLKTSDGCASPVWQLHSGSGCGNLLASTSATCAVAANGVIGSASVSAASAVQCTQVQDPFGTVQAMPSLQLCCSPP